MGEAKDLIFEYELKKNNDCFPSMYMSVLNGCQKFNNLHLAETVYSRFGDVFASNARYLVSAGIVMANIYAKFGEFEQCKAIRARIKQKEMKKKAKFSEINIYGKVHYFFDGFEHQKDENYKMIDGNLDKLVVALKINYGYEEGAQFDERRSEKLALIYALMSTP